MEIRTVEKKEKRNKHSRKKTKNEQTCGCGCRSGFRSITCVLCVILLVCACTMQQRNLCKCVCVCMFKTRMMKFKQEGQTHVPIFCYEIRVFWHCRKNTIFRYSLYFEYHLEMLQFVYFLLLCDGIELI